MIPQGAAIDAVRLAASALPVAVVLGLMLGRGWGAARAGLAAWLVALAGASLALGAGPMVVVVSQIRALILAAYVLYIIWAALLLGEVMREAGAPAAIGRAALRATRDPTTRALVLAWPFASFVQGATGFGVPVAVVAPLLVALGEPPLVAVVMATVGHAWAVTFGSLASSVVAMSAVTGVPETEIAPWSALVHGALAAPTGVAVAWIHGGRRAAVRSLPFVLVVGAVMGIVQGVVAVRGPWPVSALLAGLAGLGASAAILAARPSEDPVGAHEEHAGGAAAAIAHEEHAGGAAAAVAGYGLLVAVVVSGSLEGPLRDALQYWTWSPVLPATATALGWRNAAGPAVTIAPLAHPGALILASAAAAWLLYRLAGLAAPGSAARIAEATLIAARRPTGAVVAMAGLSALMADSGMMVRLASALADAAGAAVVWVAPLIGALAAVVTGSNTSGNLLLADLQRRAALAAGAPSMVVLAGQNVGGALGSVLAPSKVVVGCAAVGLAGREGEAMRRAAPWIAALLALGALLLAVASR